MYKYINLSIAVVSLLFLNACNYLDVNLDNNQLTLEKVFSKRATTERYLAQVYSYLPNEIDILNSEGSVVSRSDEALLSYTYGNWNKNRQGAWGVSDTVYHVWARRYQGIHQATIFMENVHRCEELSQDKRIELKAEARFLRAYFYFTLFRQYGPVFIWGDKTPDTFIKPEDIDRHTVKENLDFIFSEYAKAAQDLPLKVTADAEYGHVTKASVLAAKSELALYAARPLFNGCDLYKGQMKNRYGNYLFPQESDPNKWEEAAQAAKDVIDLGLFSLYEYKGDAANTFVRNIKSYMNIYFEKWNDEIIWAKWENSGAYGGYYQRTLPKGAIKGGGNSGTGVSLKLVDSYPMAESGRFPIIGYNNAIPIIDPKSGYQADGFTSNWMHPLDNFGPIKAHNSVIGRDARFYASILANGMYWIEKNFQPATKITFFQGGTSSYSTVNECLKSGFLWRRFTDPTVNGAEYKYVGIAWPYYRLAEIYLNYAEACNEKPSRDESEALKYLNKIRTRVGLNKIEEAYPEALGNKELLRDLIRKERMVELAFEGHRFYDVRTWMIAEKEFNQPAHTLNLRANNYEDSWKRVDNIFDAGKLVFEKKHYFFPINHKQLGEMKNITQNYGW